MVSACFFKLGLSVLGLFLVAGSPVKQDKMLSVFVFCFLLGFVLSYARAPRREQKIARKELSAVLAGIRHPLFYGFLLVQMDNQEQRGFAFVLRLAFMGSSFLRVRFCIINFGEQTGLVVGNVRLWLVSPGFSSSFLSSSSPPVACRRDRRLLLLFRRLDDATSPPLPEGSSPQIVWLLFGFLSSLPSLRC